MTAGRAVAPTNPTITGKRSRAATAAGDERSISSSTGQEDEPPRKRTAWQPPEERRVGAATSELPEPGPLEPPGIISVGNISAPSTSEARSDAAGMYIAALDAMKGAPTTTVVVVAGNGALAAPAGIVTTPVALGVEPPHRETAVGARATPLEPPGTAGALADPPPRPLLASSGGQRQPNFFEMPPIDVGVESGECGHDATPPPPVLSPVPEPPHAIVEGAATGVIPHIAQGRFHQAPSLIQQVHGASLATAAAAFGAAVDPQAAPIRGVESHLGTNEGLILVAALRRRPPFVPLLPAESAGGGTETESGGGVPRPKNKKSAPAAAGKRRKRRKCGTEGCKRRPTFGVEGTRQAQFCASHKPESFVNVLCKRCDVEGCKHQPSFGVPGAKPARCATHRSDGMVNLLAPKCASPGCRVVPSFARPGSRKVSACAAHRRTGDVDIVTRRCHHEGCVHRPVFGDVSAGKALYCSAHKLDGTMCARHLCVCVCVCFRN